MLRVASLSLRWPRATLWSVALLTVLLSFGIPDIRPGLGYRPLLGGDHPAIQSLEGFIRQFGHGFPIFVSWKCDSGAPCDTIFDASAVEMADSIATALASEEGVTEILTPYSTGLWSDRLQSRDASAGAIAVFLEDARGETAAAVVDHVRELLTEYEASGFRFNLVGHGVEFAVAGRQLADSALAILAMMVFAVAISILVFSGSIAACAASIITVSVALAWTLGIVGWMRLPMDGFLQTLTPLILAIGVCDSVHFTSRYRQSGHRGRQALVRSARELGQPCLFTSLTTAAALLSFSSTELPAFTRFGIVAAAGIATSLLLTFSLLPVLLHRFQRAKRPARRRSDRWSATLDSLFSATERRAKPILVVSFAILGVFGVACAFLLRVDTDGYEMYGASHPLVGWLAKHEDDFARPDVLELLLRWNGEPEADLDRSIDTVRDFQISLLAVEQLGRSASVADLALRTSGGRLEPDSATGASRVLGSLALEHSRAVDSWMSRDSRLFRVSVEAPSLSYSERRDVLDQLGAVAGSLPPGWSLSSTGPFAIGVDWIGAVQSAQFRGFVVAFVLSLALVALLLRSIWWSVVSMFPTVFAVVFILGVMGFAGLSLDVGRAMIGAVLLGVTIDNAIHLLTQYRRMLLSGSPPHQAVRLALLYVGRPAITSSLALAVGFLLLMASPWQTISSFGFLAGFAMLVALGAGLVVLPALLLFPPREAGARIESSAGKPALEVPAQRALRFLLVTAPVVATLGLATLEAVGPGQQRLACWLLPNGRVSPIQSASLSAECPLRASTQVRLIRSSDGATPAVDPADFSAVAAQAVDYVQIDATVSGILARINVPVVDGNIDQRLARVMVAALLAAVLLFTPVLVCWKSRSPAALPFGLFFALSTILVVVSLSGERSVWLARVCVAAAAFAPATLAHLALTLPRQALATQRARPLLAGPYLLSAFLLPAGLTALERDTLIWPAVAWSLGAFALASWLGLLSSCASAVYRSASSADRARARLLLLGSLILPATLLVASGTAGGGKVQTLHYYAFSAVALPLPMALAISRYSLFGLGHPDRRLIARLLCVVCAALAMTVVAALVVLKNTQLREALDPASAFLVFMAFAMVIELAGGFGVAERIISPEASLLRATRERFVGRLRELRTHEEISLSLCQAVQDALRPGNGVVFIRSGDTWRPSSHFGSDPPLSLALVPAALALLTEHSVRVLGDADPGRSSSLELSGTRAEVIASLGPPSGPNGLLILCGDSALARRYEAVEVEFLATVADHAGLALYNADLASELVATERNATAGRIAVALAHDLRKDLDWIGRIATRLPARLPDPRRTSRDLTLLRELVGEVRETIETFVRSSRGSAPKGSVALDGVVQSAVEVVTRRHQDCHVTRSVSPGARDALVHENVFHVLVNLLDNAIRAGGSEPVHVFCSCDTEGVQIIVTDSGTGIPAGGVVRGRLQSEAAHAQGNSGMGVGLAISNEIMNSLSGALTLTPGPGGGTSATIQLPAWRGI